ncbi:MAG: hypothetical protein Harvfovirus10_33 [Harvfovirus sp.]|uniref:Uncharacterized protein n=1 Tax=Harvfovirus sp. TaxID=2487768 RepID=A0A3G5A153_9VIRU|nr:MAG: hypothetical protein Harvfovirus10_33 [Harvfovirus sp.]
MPNECNCNNSSGNQPSNYISGEQGVYQDEIIVGNGFGPIRTYRFSRNYTGDLTFDNPIGVYGYAESEDGNSVAVSILFRTRSDPSNINIEPLLQIGTLQATNNLSFPVQNVGSIYGALPYSHTEFLRFPDYPWRPILYAQINIDHHGNIIDHIDITVAYYYLN